TYTGADNQLWKFEAVGGNSRIVARHSGKALDVQGASTANGAAVGQFTAGVGANQQWKLSAP
ncbi:MAG: RICIN domain-containing protein, partial [Akkermansiaceae bacterium]|nr:RICIN domain-containing protein [Verrucomicrobiales bacterium]